MSSLTITDVARNLLRDGQTGNLGAGVVDTRVYYFAIGTGTASPSTSDTTLQTEVFRKAVTAYTDVTTGECIITCYLSPSDAVGVAITEIGWFAGASATATPNSGVLVGRALYSHTHTNLESIQFTLDSTI